MKKIIVLIALFLPIFVKSQDTIKLPAPIAKKVVKDLISCDSLKLIHQVTKEQLVLTEAKVSMKDEIIESYVQKGTMYEDRIKNEQQKYEIQKQWIEDLRKQNKGLKSRLLYTKIVLGTGIGILTYFFITK
jgi:hypothetical protein